MLSPQRQPHFRLGLLQLLAIWVPLASLYLMMQRTSCAQLDQFSIANQKTADLSVLINETLAINNKTPADPSKLPAKDEWTFDRVEYDLIEFLQDLSARYKNSSTNYQDAPVDSDSPLEGKVGEKPKTSEQQQQPIASSTPQSLNQGLNNNTQASTKLATTTAKVEDSSTTAAKVEDPTKATTTIKLQTSVQISSTSSGSISTAQTSVTVGSSQSVSENQNTATSPARPPTPPPSPLSTSLASGDDHEIAESSWQYGIFDRFTRAKTTSTTTTKEPNLVFDSNGRINMRNFNSDECGLRTYAVEDVQPAYFQDPFEAEASKELNQRRQRPPVDDRHQYESPVDYLAGVNEAAEEAAAEGYDNNYKSQQDSSGASDAQPPPVDQQNSPADSEFNLASRRHWLQQQLGNTLQLLGFNATNQSAAALELINQTSGGVSLNLRENMMKKSGKIHKASKLVPDINLLAQPLTSRQDDLKLEARVIGGSDARLGDSPWSVSLQALVSKPGTVGVEYRHYCGGTIISEYYVLTAAHCLDFMVGRESRLFVVIGDLNWRMNAASLHGRRFGIDKLIIHSGYKSTAFGHDIGLIKTKESMKPLKVNGKYIVNSVCLPERGVEHTGEAELVGWGLFSNRNEMADTLQVADVPILPRPLCVDLYKRRTGLIQWLIGIELITDKQVCAGTFGRGICQGDSGSALVVNEKLSATPKVRDSRQISKILRGPSPVLGREQSKATIIGIVAFGGIRRCSYQSLPGVYMQTSKYMDWILPRIQE